MLYPVVLAIKPEVLITEHYTQSVNMNPSSREHPQTTHAGPRSTGGMAASQQTPANAHLGQDKPGVFDAQGAVGKQFTRE